MIGVDSAFIRSDRLIKGQCGDAVSNGFEQFPGSASSRMTPARPPPRIASRSRPGVSFGLGAALFTNAENFLSRALIKHLVKHLREPHPRLLKALFDDRPLKVNVLLIDADRLLFAALLKSRSVDVIPTLIANLNAILSARRSRYIERLIGPFEGL